jgi:hypothetical protein
VPGARRADFDAFAALNVTARNGRKWPRDRRSAEERYQLAPFQLIELHSIPASQGRIAGYRIGGE